jgi:spermidine/putrescine transport system ATP-binding protein
MSQPVELDHVTMRFARLGRGARRVPAHRGRRVLLGARAFGCGKTTVLRLVSGFMEPSEGAIRIGGQDMRGIGPTSARPR